MPNRLINETSPYLLQHAHNPVDWYPWGEEALKRAREEDKPILLSIGYSACHWCHVMEHESFENPAIAKLMNQDFISIKVDREERPDLDNIYMQAVQAMSGHGGWPLTVFLTPDTKPFYGGTYFPPEDQRGMPGFPRVLQAIVQAYRNKRGDIQRQGTQLVGHLRQSAQMSPPDINPLTPEVLYLAYQGLKPQFDSKDGGFGLEPKFPQPMALEFILRYHHRTKDPQALSMVELTLKKMAHGGIYDHLGGGFHRYSTDSFWLVPHFEKMLYDNALLARLYLHAYQVTHEPLYKRVAEETLEYLLREMAHPDGGFFSTQDADSDGSEGKYYIWRPEEIRSILGQDEGSLFCRYFGVTAHGNFEGQNILFIPRESSNVAEEAGMTENELLGVIQKGKRMLRESRSKRIPPGRDDKVLTAWNGMVVRSLAEAGAAFHREDFLKAAEKSASFLLNTMRPEGRLLRSFRDGLAKGKGFLEDYAFLIDGLLALYEATFEYRWLKEAQALADSALGLFWDSSQELFYDTGRDHEQLIIRPRDIFDNATPCGSSTISEVLQRLGVLTGDPDYSRIAVAPIRPMKEMVIKYPTGFAHWLCTTDLYLSTPKEIAIIGPLDQPSTQALLDVVYQSYLPNRVLATGLPSDNDSASIPLLEDKALVEGRPAAYICQNYTCQAPITEPAELLKQLSQ